VTKNLKVWLTVISTVILASGMVGLGPRGRSARAQDAPAQSLTAAEALTITLLQQIVSQLVELNHSVGRLPAPMASESAH
jgi:Na+-transporting NADH:ubiquinone oxidoreductase subunit NqrC